MEAFLYNNRVEVTDPSPEELSLLKRVLKIDYYRHNGRRRVFDKTVNLLSKKDGSWFFPPGMLNYVAKKLEKINVDIDLYDERIQPLPHIKFKNVKNPEPWPNQKACLEASLEEDNEVGFFCGVTGSGKSRVIEEIVKLRGVTTLIITPRSEIQYGLYQKFSKLLPKGMVSMKIPKGEVSRTLMDETLKTSATNVSERYLEEKGFTRYGSNWLKTRKASERKKSTSDPKIFITCFQSLLMADVEFLKSIEMVFVDEGHTAKNDTIRNSLSMMENAYFRYAISATMWADNANDLKVLMSSVGDNCIYEELPVDTINDGRVKKPIVQSRQAPLPDHPVGYWKKSKNKSGNSTIVYSKDWDEIVKLGLVGNHSRNLDIVNMASDLYRDGHRILICIHEELHGHILMEILESKGIECSYIYGREKKSLKREIIEDTQTGIDPHVFIGTSAVGLGVDTKNLTAAILADVRKSSIAVFQFIGRALRMNELAMEATIINYIDWFHPKLKEHSLIRERLCDEYYGKNKSFTDKKWKGIK